MQATRGSIELHALSASFGSVVVVQAVTLRIEPGERVAVVGANGSGKSTLLRCLLGLHRGGQTGEVTLDGCGGTAGKVVDARRRAVTYVPQRPPSGRFPLRVRELVSSSPAPAEGVAAACRLGLRVQLDRSVDTLSGGQVQRAFIARALGCVAAGAVALAADEPTSALDFAGQEEVAEILLGLGVTTVVVTHDTAFAARCDRVLTMAAGELREGLR